MGFWTISVFIQHAPGKNIGTFLIVLFVACFSFVLIGGFLFFKFKQLCLFAYRKTRNQSQSLEECMWEAWACLCSSSTHLRVLFIAPVDGKIVLLKFKILKR
ncbi:hypothetical protein MKX01_035793 [Papaver californicum]|nr:hypothetical protein MKX01_035793 [Papaver californicum]